MRFVRKYGIAMTVVICCVALIGCSEEVTQPESDGLDAFAASIVENDLVSLAGNGWDLQNSKGVFSMRWKEVFGPFQDDEMVVGRAMAVAFGENPDKMPPYAPAGVDMGSVFINYGESQIELLKRVAPRGGVVYATFSRPLHGETTSIDFVPDGIYQFDITGSDQFAAVDFMVAAPPALLSITSHEKGEEIGADQDLILRWQGGSDSEGVVIWAAAFDREPRQWGPQGHHRPPRPFQNAPAIIEVLETNPGEYTISAATLADLLDGGTADALVLHVSQTQVDEIEHDGGVIHAIIRNGDGVILTLP